MVPVRRHTSEALARIVTSISVLEAGVCIIRRPSVASGPIMAARAKGVISTLRTAGFRTKMALAAPGIGTAARPLRCLKAEEVLREEEVLVITSKVPKALEVEGTSRKLVASAQGVAPRTFIEVGP